MNKGMRLLRTVFSASKGRFFSVESNSFYFHVGFYKIHSFKRGYSSANQLPAEKTDKGKMTFDSSFMESHHLLSSSSSFATSLSSNILQSRKRALETEGKEYLFTKQSKGNTGFGCF